MDHGFVNRNITPRVVMNPVREARLKASQNHHRNSIQALCQNVLRHVDICLKTQPDAKETQRLMSLQRYLQKFLESR